MPSGKKVLPRRLVEHAYARSRAATVSRRMLIAGWVVTAAVAFLSIDPLANMLSTRQIMNTSFDPLNLVNTYGAFGSIGRERLAVIFEGTDADTPFDPETSWKPYPYIALPVDTNKMPRQVAPYQPRLDWQMWFAAMSTPQNYPWTLNLVSKLLHNDADALSLFANNPFPADPPKFVRATLYRYKFAGPNNRRPPVVDARTTRKLAPATVG